MENVPLLATSPRFIDFTRLLERHRYQWTAAIVNAALYGSCQTRQRLVLVAIHESVRGGTLSAAINARRRLGATSASGMEN